jgi:hypothetical protein
MIQEADRTIPFGVIDLNLSPCCTHRLSGGNIGVDRSVGGVPEFLFCWRDVTFVYLIGPVALIHITGKKRRSRILRQDKDKHTVVFAGKADPSFYASTPDHTPSTLSETRIDQATRHESRTSALRFQKITYQVAYHSFASGKLVLKTRYVLFRPSLTL